MSPDRPDPLATQRRAGRPSVYDLQNNPAFVLLTTLPHKAAAPFVAEYYQRSRTPFVFAHYALSAAVLIAWILSALSGGLSAESFIITAGLAVAGSIVLVPLHEAIHGLAYRLLGARDVRFALSLRKLYAYAIANQFVVDSREFVFVALLPLALVSVCLVLAAAALEPYRVFCLGLLFFHMAGTSGDWASVNYLRLHRAQAVYAYDDAGRRESYFYARQDAAG